MHVISTDSSKTRLSCLGVQKPFISQSLLEGLYPDVGVLKFYLLLCDLID